MSSITEKKSGKIGVIAMVVFGFIFVAGLRHPPQHAAAGVPGTNAQVVAPPPEGAGLADISIQVITLNKVAFGNVLEATFSIGNRNRYAVKDITVTCRHAANSGSFIDSNTRTIYEVIPARGSTYVRNFNMGFIHTQASGSVCAVTDFTRV